MAEPWQEAGFGLYIHWPFCAAKCPYCDFNSHVSASIDQHRWLNAYRSEIDRVAAETSDRVLSSVFFGGGTPSLMDPVVVEGVLSKIRAAWPVANDLEVTLEANPTSTEAERFRAYADAGVNRLSLGVQALDDTDLRRLGRLHTAREALDAFALARAVFPRVSFDLIYARQDQTRESWRRELGRALSLAADHLSLYQLTIEDGTAFGERHRRGLLRGLPSEDLGADLFEITQEITDAAGFDAYETSNHARLGAEACHNLTYWRSGDYLGIGPGAHGRITFSGRRHATETILSPVPWLLSVEKSGTGESRRETLTSHDRLAEFLMMGLRLVEGVSSPRLAALQPSDEIVNKINDLREERVLIDDGDRLRVAPGFRPVLNAVLTTLLA